MKLPHKRKEKGFSLIEIMISMTILLLLMGLISGIIARSLSARERESRRTDALTASQAAMNMISREIGNSGYGLKGNGIVLADSDSQKMRIRANINNGNSTTDAPGEDIIYYYDAQNAAIVRYDPNDDPRMSVVINSISQINFKYFDYFPGSASAVEKAAPTANTGRVRISITVKLTKVSGQPDNQKVSFTTDILLRNSEYMLKKY